VAVTSDAARSTARATGGALSIAIIDDEPLAHRGVRHLVSVQAGFHVVGEAVTGTEARASRVRAATVAPVTLRGSGRPMDCHEILALTSERTSSPLPRLPEPAFVPK
jgi:DNA-binding NarL/FixJ family response regulator